jgi:hypothetical protein
MAKFGRFENGAAKPIETYEGDYMHAESSHVRIFKGSPILGKLSNLVATIRLGKAQSVREIAEGTRRQKAVQKSRKLLP